MAKPSVTNIRPPSTPPKTTWDLNTDSDPNYLFSNTVASGDNFDVSVAKLNVPTQGPHFDFNDYAYVFYGVNGGVDESVTGKTSSSGVIVTGNGMDHVTGGALADIVFAGNGKDVVDGKAGNDILYGENGADTLNGGSDAGKAIWHPGSSTATLVLDQTNHNLWQGPLPGLDGSPVDAIYGDNKVRKEGVYFQTDSAGHPTETDLAGNPIAHTVYSFTPDADGSYTFAYSHGNVLDGDGPPEPNQFQMLDLQEGKTYFFSFVSEHGEINVDVFAGAITVTSPINDGNSPNNLGNPTSIATSQGMPEPNWESFFGTKLEGGTPTYEFKAGDHLIGGNGPDTFVWNANDDHNVDVIWDFNNGDGLGFGISTDRDVLELQNTSYTSVEQLVASIGQNNIFSYDVDGDGAKDDLVINLGENHAIGLVGVSDFDAIKAQIIFSTVV